MPTHYNQNPIKKLASVGKDAAFTLLAVLLLLQQQLQQHSHNNSYNNTYNNPNQLIILQ